MPAQIKTTTPTTAPIIAPAAEELDFELGVDKESGAATGAAAVLAVGAG
jgi:hypothetical protein